jgi:hypothetical protein
MSLSTTKIIKTVTLNEGEKFVLPSGATILNIFTSGVSSYTSNCDNIPDATPFKCFVFSWEINATPAFTDAYFSEIIIKDSFKYSIPDPDGFASNQYEDGGSEAEKLSQAILSINGFVGDVIAYDQSGGGSLRQIKLSLPDMGKIPLLKLIQPNAGSGQVLYLEGVETDCLVPGGWTGI